MNQARWRLADLSIAIWRERRVLALVFGACAALGVVAAIVQKSAYEAQARLLIRLGQEYVFQPQVGAAGAGAFPMLQQVVNAEVKLLQSPEVARRVALSPESASFFPEFARDLSGPNRERALRAIERDIQLKFSVVTTPETPIIATAYTADDAQRAAKILNALVDTYISYRSDVLVGRNEGALSQQSAAFETRAREAGAAVQRFLAKHGIGDFDAELRTLGELQGRLDSELAETVAKSLELSSQASALNQRTQAQPAEIELYADNDAAKKLVDLQLERAQLLGRYQPDAPPVREIEGRIAELQSAVTAAGASATRRGPNPIRQTIETQYFEVEANARAQAARESALSTQKARTIDRLRLLQSVETEYRQLVRDRVILEDNARAFRARAEEASAFAKLSGLSTDSVRSMERATPPTQAKGSRALIAVGLALLGLILGAAAALVRGITRDMFLSARDAGARLEIPVLAVSLPEAPNRERSLVGATP